MRDVYLWTGYALGTVILAVLIKGAVRRWLDWSDRRSYVPPTIRTSARPAPAPLSERWEAKVQALPAAAVDELLTAVDIRLANIGGPSSWALDALSDARKDASDTYASLGEFARRVPTGPALIWAELDGIFTARGLVTV